jgi:hypothetical protein
MTDRENIEHILDRLLPENRETLLAQARLTLIAETAVRRQYGLSAEGIPAQAVRASAHTEQAGVGSMEETLKGSAGILTRIVS